MTNTPEKPKPPMSGVMIQSSGTDMNFQLRVALAAANLAGKALLQWRVVDGAVVIEPAREVL
jgi:hypothetical protein